MVNIIANNWVYRIDMSHIVDLIANMNTSCVLRNQCSSDVIANMYLFFLGKHVSCIVANIHSRRVNMDNWLFGVDTSHSRFNSQHV